MPSEFGNAEERKRIFKFYKMLSEEQLSCENLDLSLDAFVNSTTLHNTDNNFIKSSFILQYNLNEEFYILRSSIIDDAVMSFYEQALFHWPFATYAKSNLSDLNIDSVLWFESLLEYSRANGKSNLLDRLRWVTLGYHYDWFNKTYQPGCRSPFPVYSRNFFKSVASLISGVVGNNESILTRRPHYENFIPEASIVNYYRKKTTMGFHVDDSEVSRVSPLISISLGRPAIFLLETSTHIEGLLPHGNDRAMEKSIIPIVLRHGDIMVTGGHSRLAFHAVPRLMSWESAPNDLPLHFFTYLLSKLKGGCGDVIDENLKKYVFSTRLNINVRQVNVADHCI